MIYIGIDPDCDKSGVAVWNSKNKALQLYNLTFFQLYDSLKEIEKWIDVKVKIEAGFLNKKSNYHYSVNNFTAQKIALKVGANHETARKIGEMCEYLELKYEFVCPKSSKVDSKYFEKLTGFKRSNQEQRDAAMLVFGL